MYSNPKSFVNFLHGNSPYSYSNYAAPKSLRKLNGDRTSLCFAGFCRKLWSDRTADAKV
ncbi:hypothetical protein QUB11_07405 [Microcoleus sp. B6-A1]|uniref:hypothetical protein n=1 Tax=unclassified Microcoleus TaxID=2642155 RepID=UPI002FD4A64B